MIIIKIIFACIVCIVLSLIISEINPEFKIYFTVIFGIIIIIFLFEEISTKIIEFKSIINLYNIEIENIKVILKIILVAYLCDFVSLLCKDLGHESIGKKVEIAGKFIILIYSFDILRKFIDEVIILINR